MVGERGWRKTGWVLLFLLPSLSGLAVFSLTPILASLGLTLFDWDLLTPPRFIGLDNFSELFTSDDFWAALGHTLYFIAGYIPLVLVLALGLALILNQKLRGIMLYRAAFYLPVVSAWVAVALLWKWIFNPKFGLVNYLLGLIGIAGPGWLFDPNWAMPAIILTSVWKDIGFVMVMFLAGLQGIPADYYEAAAIDGADRWQSFWSITRPLLAPTTFFALIISLINSFQVFDQVWIMSGGGPAGATTVLVEQIVKNAFSYSRMGYASALSWVLFLLVFAATAVQMRLQQTWVSYE
ncbi:MAG TPA: sugar ABC transporter permease [Anaerolineales bacterium]|nr:sugar ABC transporter permease [Anaerolineales bacterium]